MLLLRRCVVGDVVVVHGLKGRAGRHVDREPAVTSCRYGGLLTHIESLPTRTATVFLVLPVAVSPSDGAGLVPSDVRARMREADGVAVLATCRAGPVVTAVVTNRSPRMPKSTTPERRTWLNRAK